MNISLCSQNLYLQLFRSNTQRRSQGILNDPVSVNHAQANKKSGNAFIDPYQHLDDPEEKKRGKSVQVRELLRNLKQSRGQEQDPCAGAASQNEFMELSGTKDEDKKDEAKPASNYNFKEVETKILRAKNTVSAEQAVLSASRKVLEVKAKISSGDGDPEELQLMLTHAKRMELTARKKKRHLELEEMAKTTGERDERADQTEKACSDMKNAVIAFEEEKVTEKEDAIFEERQEMAEEASDSIKESGTDNSGGIPASLNEMISEFGEEELKELSEAMEALSDMEIIDPHMDREELEELKRKHRAAEQKEIVKADMDYLKGMIRHQLEKGEAFPGPGLGVSMAGSAFPMAEAFSAPVTAAEGASVDVAV
ncbi:MAG: hypothetical protein K5770_13665 [Lachnospiraceae bacterium]|nr:hypothetical protein [Lachnospiraceae bacterium]